MKNYHLVTTSTAAVSAKFNVKNYYNYVKSRRRARGLWQWRWGFEETGKRSKIKRHRVFFFKLMTKEP